MITLHFSPFDIQPNDPVETKQTKQQQQKMGKIVHDHNTEPINLQTVANKKEGKKGI